MQPTMAPLPFLPVSGKRKGKEKTGQKERKRKRTAFTAPGTGLVKVEPGKILPPPSWEDGATTHLPRRWRFLPCEPEGPEDLYKARNGGYLCGLFYFLWVIWFGFLICEPRGCDDSEADGARSLFLLHCW